MQNYKSFTLEMWNETLNLICQFILDFPLRVSGIFNDTFPNFEAFSVNLTFEFECYLVFKNLSCNIWILHYSFHVVFNDKFVNLEFYYRQFNV